MSEMGEAARDRRALVKNGLVLGSLLAVPGAVSAAQKMARLTSRDLKPMSQPPVPGHAAPVLTSSKVVRPELLRRALASLQRHGDRVKRDRIAIVDFAAPSSQPRLHFLDIASGRSTSLLVAHGSGSDPAHTGYLARFSNQSGSNASCEGAFLAADYYVGKHGRSQRLIGLDPTNDNALSRAIVVHAAWYANKDMLRTHGMLGRSQGCFAVGESDLAEMFARLGEGRMIYATKV
ncbi:murein L,D-transpeptidase catalytic domain family protein [Sphingomonas sp.]|uniref:murein L,D-transpeptidase catalytic domain family protein n=1 Tax=Sphingomonas sp. TaxID=28214 RepID=UPI0035BBEA06